MSALWRGSWATRIRVVSGLVLFTYALFHFINLGLGLFSPQLMDQFQNARQLVSRSFIGTVILYGAILAHAGLAMFKLAGRRTLRMPVWEATQIVLGLLIPLLLVTHIIFTRAAHEIFDVNDRYEYLIGLIWGSSSARNQSLLLLIVWTHGCIGLHFWLNSTRWWRRNTAWLSALAALVPGFALAGFLVEGRRVSAALGNAETRAPLLERLRWPSSDAIGRLIEINNASWWLILSILMLVAVIFFGRKLWARRNLVQIQYIDGPTISSAKGPTLLEMSRANGVPHTSLCGGRGRCTTCRVIVETGSELLHPPSPTEMRSLRAVNAPPNARLACQIRPTDVATVFRVFQPDGRHGRAHASQGLECRLAVLFLDMRGFTARTTGQLPYDVVFLLNRFFDAIVPAVMGAGGTVDKYLGDGFLAVFETGDEKSSALAGLKAAGDIGAALEQFNLTMTNEGAPAIAIGVGLHLGEVVLGEIGAAGHAPRTLIGDTVNAASRLEGQTKELGVEVLISEAVLISAGVNTIGLDLISLELRGVADPVPTLAVKHGTQLPALLAGAQADPPLATGD